MARRVRVSSHHETRVAHFDVLSVRAGCYATPDAIGDAWASAPRVAAPATAAAAVPKLDMAAPPDFDGCEHWFRARLLAPAEAGPCSLVLEGVATVADVFLGAEPVLHSENMFRRHVIALPASLAPDTELFIRCGALSEQLAKRRPRPRFRTRIVAQQQLRFIRTSLIGRTPGFCPRVPIVGPYRPVWLTREVDLRVLEASARPHLAEDGTGRLSVFVRIEFHGTSAVDGRARLVLRGAAIDAEIALAGEVGGREVVFAAELSLGTVAPWWPHTHGVPALSELCLQLEGGVSLALGKVGFRRITQSAGPDGRGFELAINGVPVFCRGACWTVDELVTQSEAGLSHTLALVRDAGMNMLRLGGTTLYESDAFYDLCDELGILVFQDFMFSNMDYPATDEAFVREVRAEVRDVLTRLGERPCLTVLCGGSEVEQQVAMLGLPRELSTSPLFYELLPELVRELAPGVPYVPSSPCFGELPFQADTGICHYYAVGAYMRPVEDARRSHVRFAAECLAFANVPCAESIEAFMGDLEMPFHHPRWKERVPRDRGVGWDFEDVRDHYVRTLYGVDPMQLRYGDPERYLDLARTSVVEVIEGTFCEWRRHGSSCRGGLVFWLKDFWLGAGWGVLDARGLPKSAYYALAHVCQSVALCATDEGMNGVVLHAVNDTAERLETTLSVALFRHGEVPVAQAQRAITLAPRSTQATSVEGMLQHFIDTAYLYRFGPPSYDVLVATLGTAARVLSRAFFLPLGHGVAPSDVGLLAVCTERDGVTGVEVSTRAFAQRIELAVDGHLPADNYFQLEPGGRRWVALTPRTTARTPIRGTIRALNARTPASFTFKPSTP